MKIFAACALALALSGCSGVTAIVARHAEKQAGKNPNLTPDGHQRAEALQAAAARAGVQAIYVTGWCRTAQTALPLARALALPLYVQAQRSEASGLDACEPAIDVPMIALDPAIETPRQLAEHVAATEGGRTVLIVGHSNTVSSVVEGLGAPGFGDLDHLDYDNLFVVIDGRLVRGKFGAPDPTPATGAPKAL